jgi:hypothetical protein
MGSVSAEGYSSQVELYLVVAGVSHPLSRIGNGCFSFREPRDLPAATQGQLIVKVDGREDVRSVVLPDGAARSSDVVKFS